MKYTCQPTENSLDELGIPKNPFFDPSLDSVALFSRFLEGEHSMPPPTELPKFVSYQIKGYTYVCPCSMMGKFLCVDKLLVLALS